MKILLIPLAIGCIWAITAVATQIRRITRRRAAVRAPFPDNWTQILERNLRPYNKLSTELKEQLNTNIKVFIAEKPFEACGGLTMTDEIKVTIAAQACMLLLNRKNAGYPRLRSVVVYPNTYVAGGQGIFGGKQSDQSVRLGESWPSGSVVLSWSDVKQGAFNFQDGHNVTMHEFAHQLDQEDGVADGAPILERRSAYSSWAKVLSREFEHLQNMTEKGKSDVMDAYGASDPAEFFAVATESFFEKPHQLRRKHPSLYEELKNYYRINPVEWT